MKITVSASDEATERLMKRLAKDYLIYSTGKGLNQWELEEK